jgi:uncharacterized protein with PQ loop repeat
MHPHKHLHGKIKKSPLDFLVYFFMVATPLFEIPQAIAIYGSKDAASVSIWTWAFFLMSSVVWFSYGVRNKLLPIMVTYSLYFVVESIIVIGIFKYS